MGTITSAIVSTSLSFCNNYTIPDSKSQEFFDLFTICLQLREMVVFTICLQNLLEIFIGRHYTKIRAFSPKGGAAEFTICLQFNIDLFTFSIWQ
jgi:hypothetical protein